jgi:hypothetical protein
MWTALVVSLVFAAPPSKDAPPPGETPAKRELFAAEEWYKKQKGEERSFVGLLERMPGSGPGTVGFARTNPYRLVMEEKDKKSVREIHVGGKSELLTPYVGKKAKLIGKAVDMEVEGKQHHEIWPARVELMATEKKTGAAVKAEGDRELTILARGVWPVRQAKPTQLIIRNGEELALAHRISATDAKDTRLQIAVGKDVLKLLKVETIDWKKNMLVVVTAGMKPTAGYSVEVLTLPLKGKTLTVRWRLNSPKPGSHVTQRVTHPSQMVLVERFDGSIQFDPPAKEKD